MLDQQASQLLADARRLAGDSTIATLTTHPGAANHAAAMATLLARPAGASAGWEIRDVNQHTMLTAGALPAISRGSDVPVAPADTASVARVSPVFTASNGVWFALHVPVRDKGRRTGTLLEYRKLSSAQGAELLARLVGPGVVIHLGNASGDGWTDFRNPVPAPPLHALSTPTTYVRGDTARVGLLRPVANTPWLLLLELPQYVLTEPAAAFLRSISLTALLVIVAGAVAAWEVSRRITTPLAEVATAAEGIAAGDYSRRVRVARRDELGRLASGFNTMAARVEDANAELERRVAERGRALEMAQQELVKRERLAILGQLAGGVGHELRNPLGVMTNSLYLLNAMQPDAPPVVHEYHGILRNQIALAERIVSDLLDFARVKPPQRQAVSLATLVREQVDRLEPEATVSVSIDIPAELPPVCVDRVQIAQVLFNVLVNAVQSLAGGEGSVMVRARLDGGSRVRLDVVDSGTGIANADAERIFEPLFTTKARGIGLGLSVSRTLARANGGDLLLAASTPGAGSTFTILLPVGGGVA